ncbi:hypothetical protein M885DRAFT_510706 [Pelagophyceae sp. CCMP2097]|nr:hypothetical protein M885DRAFT_510706 [Pelagophyceae sp. CCMP2097]
MYFDATDSPRWLRAPPGNQTEAFCTPRLLRRGAAVCAATSWARPPTAPRWPSCRRTSARTRCVSSSCASTAADSGEWRRPSSSMWRRPSTKRSSNSAYGASDRRARRRSALACRSRRSARSRRRVDSMAAKSSAATKTAAVIGRASRGHAGAVCARPVSAPVARPVVVSCATPWPE